MSAQLRFSFIYFCGFFLTPNFELSVSELASPPLTGAHSAGVLFLCLLPLPQSPPWYLELRESQVLLSAPVGYPLHVSVINLLPAQWGEK